jgi:ribonuclease HII
MATGPTFSEETAQWNHGYFRVAGIDEAGRGPLAGPVAAAAVVLPVNFKAEWSCLVNDSKVLTASRREFLYDCLSNSGISTGVGMVDARTIDIVGIAKATRLAMKMAVQQLQPLPEYLLIDYFRLPEVRMPQKGVIEGDSRCFSIACASIIAKVTRDHLMVELDRMYPGYHFAEHKGYATKSHLESLRRLGPSPIHRVSFQPVRDALSGSKNET